MSVYTDEFVIYSTSDAEFRNWVGRYIDAMTQAGWGRARVAGEIDLATATVPTSNNTSAGFSIHYLNDSLHTVAPVYVKMEFGRGAATQLPAIWATVGKGVDDAGNITGVLIPQRQIMTTGLAGTSQATTASTGEGYACIFPLATTTGVNQIGAAGWLIIERAHNLQGQPSTEGLIAGFNATGGASSSLDSLVGNPSILAINYATGSYTESVPPVILPYSVNGVTMGTSAALAQGGIGPVFPWVLLAPGLAPFQAVCFVTLPPGDLPGGVFEVVLGGISRNYFPLTPLSSRRVGSSQRPSASTVSSGVGGVIGMRWEP